MILNMYVCGFSFSSLLGLQLAEMLIAVLVLSMFDFDLRGCTYSKDCNTIVYAPSIL